MRPQAVVSSDLRRAAATAEAVAEAAGVPLVLDADLRETDIGPWQGLTSAEIGQRWGAELDLWAAGDVNVRPAGGENRLAVATRMAAAIDRHLPEQSQGTLLLVTHGGAARVAIASLLGLQHRSWGAIGGLSNCSWSVLEERPRAGIVGTFWRLVEHNARSAPTAVPAEAGGP